MASMNSVHNIRATLLLLIALGICPLKSSEPDNSSWAILGGVSGGWMKVSYQDMNERLQRYHHIDGIEYSIARQLSLEYSKAIKMVLVN